MVRDRDLIPATITSVVQDIIGGIKRTLNKSNIIGLPHVRDRLRVLICYLFRNPTLDIKGMDSSYVSR